VESARFDRWSRRLGEASRRGLLRSTLGVLAPTALVALLGDPEAADAAKNGRCKPTCGTCQRCKKGKCKKKNNGKKTCKKGKCRPAPVGTPCEEFTFEGECCGPDTGNFFSGCCPVNTLCCPNSAGGGCCSSLDLCCSVNDDCENPLATCNFGCCDEL
jgi:hypothetical protein